MHYSLCGGSVRQAAPPSLKKIAEQVVVITEATSGAALATSLLAAERGAQVVLCAQNENDLRDAVCRIRQNGGEAIYVLANVANIDEVDWVASRTLAEYGRIDSWINQSVFSNRASGLVDISIEEKHQVFEVNFWGVVHGCRAAIKAMKKNSGAVVNVSYAHQGNSLSTIIDCAVETYTNALAIEIEKENPLISVNYLQPTTESDAAAKILALCETPGQSFFRTAVENPGKSAVVAAGLGVAAYAAFKAIRNARKLDEATH